jgi:hypothetical protein
MNKSIAPRPYGDPDAAARKIVELASAIPTIQDGRIYIDEIKGPFLGQLKGTPAEYEAGLRLALDRGWLTMHESQAFVRLSRTLRKRSA